LQLREDIYGIDALFVAAVDRRPVADLRLPRDGAGPSSSLAP
jgi:hypothetical protein